MYTSPKESYKFWIHFNLFFGLKLKDKINSQFLQIYIWNDKLLKKRENVHDNDDKYN